QSALCGYDDALRGGVLSRPGRPGPRRDAAGRALEFRLPPMIARAATTGGMTMWKRWIAAVACAAVAQGAVAQPKTVELEFPTWQAEAPGGADYWTGVIKG